MTFWLLPELVELVKKRLPTKDEWIAGAKIPAWVPQGSNIRLPNKKRQTYKSLDMSAFWYERDYLEPSTLDALGHNAQEFEWASVTGGVFTLAVQKAKGADMQPTFESGIPIDPALFQEFGLLSKHPYIDRSGFKPDLLGIIYQNYAAPLERSVEYAKWRIFTDYECLIMSRAPEETVDRVFYKSRGAHRPKQDRTPYFNALKALDFKPENPPTTNDYTQARAIWRADPITIGRDNKTYNTILKEYVAKWKNEN